jgi:tetratricopeptide (TPR) repeat protein
MPLHPLRRLLAVLLIGVLAVSPAKADDAGQEDLDRAIDAKLSAESFRELATVAELCQSAIAKGLSKENEAFAKQLLASTLYKRAEVISEPLVEGKQFDVQSAQRWEMAVGELEQAVKADPKLVPAQMLMGRLQSLPFGKAERAKVALDAAVDLIKDDPAERAEALRLRAAVQNDAEKKVADLNEAIKLAPENYKSLRDRGNAYIAQNKPKEALADFAAAIELEPEDSATLEAQGLAYATLEQWDEARASLTKAAEANPDSPTPYVQRGRVNLLAGDNEAAIKDASKALQVAPDFVYALLLRAQAYGQDKQWDEALADAEQLIALAPGSSDAVRLWASLIVISKKTDEYLPKLQRQHEMDPDPGIALRLAMLYGAKKEYRKAIDAYSVTISQEPKNWFAFQGRADTYLGIGKQADAMQDYEQALKLDPDNSGVLNNLAWLLATSPDAELRDGKRAIELAAKACDVTDHKQAHILSTLAAAYAETGDFETAKKWSSKAVEIGEDAMKEQLAKELESYKEGKPWREMQQESTEGDKPDAEDKEANKEPDKKSDESKKGE